MKRILTLGGISVTLFFLLDGPKFFFRYKDYFSYLIFAALGFSIWFYFKNARREKAFNIELHSAICEVSNVRDRKCIDTCRTSAVALNYKERCIYVIENSVTIRKLRFDNDVLGWEYVELGRQTNEFSANVIEGASIGMFSNDSSMRSASASAMGTAAALSSIGTMLNQTPEVGTLRISLNDGTTPFVEIFISHRRFIDRFEHFWSYCKSNSA